MQQPDKTSQDIEIALALELQREELARTTHNLSKEYELYSNAPSDLTPSRSSLASFKKSDDAWGIAIVGGLIGAVIGGFYEFITWNNWSSLGDIFNGAVFVVIAAVVGLIIGAIVCGVIGYIRDSHRNSIHKKEYDKARRAANAEASRRQALNKHYSKELQDSLMKSSSLLDDANNLLEKHYSHSIIYPKYRNLVALAQIKEYLDSGRASSLGDAYDRFELETRMDAIITKLDRIVENLEAIKESQFLLYTALQQINENVTQLNSSMFQAGSTLDSLLFVSTSNAYFAEKTAKNTELLATVEAFEHRHDYPLNTLLR